MTDPIQRRSFIKTGAAALAINGKILGANDHIRIALIGAGRQGRGVMKGFARNEDVKIVAVSDVYQPHIDQSLNDAKLDAAPDGIGAPADSNPPDGLDWDQWLGPAPMRPFNANRCTRISKSMDAERIERGRQEAAAVGSILAEVSTDIQFVVETLWFWQGYCRLPLPPAYFCC